MIVLKVKEKGHLINIPGIPPVRSPVEIDISKCNVQTVITKLRSQGIRSYEIIEKQHESKKKTEKKEQEKKLTEEDKTYKKEINKRLNNLEKTISDIVSTNVGNEIENKEQITEKLETLEILTKELLKKQKTIILDEKLTKGEPEVEELVSTFIPEVDISGMKLQGKTTQKVVQQDKEVDSDDVDLLSQLLGKKN